MINCTDLKRNAVLELDGAPWQTVDVSSHSPSARGASTIIKAKVKNLLTGQVLTKSFRGGEMLELADCEKRSVQFLYSDGSARHFMDSESFEQFELTSEQLGDIAGYLTDGLECLSLMYKGQAISIEPPQIIELEIRETTPAIKGATAQAQLKPATLETGIDVLVPEYITSGERIRVDTRDGRFVGRVKS